MALSSSSRWKSRQTLIVASLSRLETG
uniref:Uncharacterized protein n=1 Tax=Oryza sativa subsp. japonica TaxID=39947 RepID=Q10CS6_ORYSJ|nr:hypothetical protein LOC_Os03g53939 [Oryza sativa Japonica Group]